MEEDTQVDSFLERASSFVDFDTSTLVLDLSECTRLWPSGLSLLCSVKQWVGMPRSGRYPTIASSSSKSEDVNAYLAHSGFYDYVARPSEPISISFPDSQIVKIRRYNRLVDIEDREKEIKDLLRRYTTLGSDDIELFDSVVLTELFSNVTEHGIPRVDDGYWLIVQYHPTHRFVSICIADNGIGIKWSLLTGPQAEAIKSTYKSLINDDGECISLALRENISGAEDALPPSPYLRRYQRGERRGHGLKHIRDVCKSLGIRFGVLSHFGYVILGPDGEEVMKGTKTSRVFAGTLYHLLVNSEKKG
jgi:hypothetical protein